MFQKIRVLTVLTGLVVWWAALATQAKAEALGWVFHQDGSYIGKQTLYVSTTGAVFKTSLATFVIKPKTGTIVAFNDKNKTFVEMPTGEWKKTFAGYFAVTPGSIIQKGSAKGTVSGFSLQQYKLMDKHKNGKLFETDEVWSAINSGVPKDISKAVTDFIDFPADFGIPIRIIRGKQTDTPVKVLDTLKIDRAAVASSMFKVPPKYRKVQTEVEVLLEGAGDSDAELFEEFSNPTPAPSKAKSDKRPGKKS